jgi:tRNA modification GTPase
MGLPALRQQLLALAGGTGAGQGAFSARARHVAALQRAGEWIQQARQELQAERLELAAEALVRAHEALGEIGGRVETETLLGHIFSSFCIGK